MQIVRPKALRRGDTISVIAPAGPVVRERIEKAFAHLQSLGYRIKTHGDVFRKSGYLAGDDSTRAGRDSESECRRSLLDCRKCAGPTRTEPP